MFELNVSYQRRLAEVFAAVIFAHVDQFFTVVDCRAHLSFRGGGAFDSDGDKSGVRGKQWETAPGGPKIMEVVAISAGTHEIAIRCRRRHCKNLR